MELNRTKDIETLLAGQLREWPLAHTNFEALDSVRVKEVELPGLTVKVQFNPARIVSSGAKVDAASVKARKCFLCAENRPAEQRGVDYGDNYTILVNPFPIFPRHFTIPDTRHTDQRIENRVADMFSLAQALPGYTVFYNGPKCGASAPDHAHFQAGNSDFLTIAPAVEKSCKENVATVNGATLSLVTGLPMSVFVIDSATPADGAALFDRLYRALPLGDDDAEPMINILCYALGDQVRMLVFPRKRHRPSFYGTEGDNAMLISPASVDMGGVFITPREQDFERLDSDIIKQLFNELCLSVDEARAIAETLKS